MTTNAISEIKQTPGTTEKAVVDSMKLARGIFALRGNHYEIHLSEEDLAAHLALAFKHGVRAAIRDLSKMIDPELEQRV